MAIAEKWDKFKPIPDDILTRLEDLPPLFGANEVLLAYHFGSLARQQRGNDVDLALLMPANTPPFRLRDAIIEKLGTERLDIVDLRRASPVLCFEIISEGKLLYAVDDEIQLASETNWLRRYKDTAWLRQNQSQILQYRIEQWSSKETALPND